MKKTLLTLSQLFLTIGLFAQVQLGSNLVGENTGDQSGRSTAISNDGSFVVVGATTAVSDINGGIFIRGGHVRVYGYNGVHWTGGDDFDATDGNDSFGSAVTMNGEGTIIVCGAPTGGTSNVGYLHAYVETGSGYIRYDGNDLVGDVGKSGFGRALAMTDDGTRLIVGGDNYVKVLEKLSFGSPWTQVGQTLEGESSSDNFGHDVAISISGTRIIVGNPASDIGGTDAGYARVYDLVGNTWTQLGNDITDVTGDNAGAGVDIASNGSRIAVSFPGDDNTNGINAGSVRTYSLNGGVWTQVGNSILGNGNNDALGSAGNQGAIDLRQSGTFIAVGSRSGITNLNGYVEVYQIPIGGNIWSKIGTTIVGSNTSDHLGFSVAMNDDDFFGTRVAMGAPQADDNGNLSGHTQVYEYSGVVLSTNEVSNSINSVNVYPNPTKDIIYITGTQPKEITVYDAQGRFIKTYAQPTNHISVSNMSKGMYFLQITDQNNAISNQKIIVQ
ncbi:T9SS type A sorting domain-containing protein [uncultured Kordia sp.]|uniref:T9SS type A sorting domain-containing protein n=1 Tax=uncultured Kordia sp. TaxID=507699 RepID=UPI00262B3027|nr:T9SS type A sorting domain-containing protein [uncultured Kordia sp.]